MPPSTSCSLWPWLVALLAASSVALCGARPDPSTDSRLTGRAILIDQTFADHRAVDSLLVVRTPEGRRVQVFLDHSSQLDGIRTGAEVELSGRWAASVSAGGVQASSSSSSSSSSLSRFQASLIQVMAPPDNERAATYKDGLLAAAATGSAPRGSNPLIPADLSIIVIPIAGLTAEGAACMPTPVPALTKAAVQRMVFKAADSQAMTVDQTYNMCSYGKTKVTPQNSMVTDVVKLPCSGTSFGVPWSFLKCDFDDFNGWADAADAQLDPDLLAKYKHRVYLLPQGACNFVGLGYVGCDGSYDCRSWVVGAAALAPQATVHELGHNLYLGHSGSSTDEYNDPTCAMGYCCTDRCFNLPKAFQMGWVKPQQLEGSNLAPGQTVRVALASQTVSDRSGLRIVASWAKDVPAAYVGYRTAVGMDANLALTGLADKVHVYTSHSNDTSDSRPSVYEGMYLAGQHWSQAVSGVVVRVVSIPATSAATSSAVVTVCRKVAESAASCAAGRDNNCNGKVGVADPACVKLMPWAPKAPKPRPPPPRARRRPPPPRVRRTRLVRSPSAP
ncbi:Autolysin [Chlorella vulgaris]